MNRRIGSRIALRGAPIVVLTALTGVGAALQLDAGRLDLVVGGDELTPIVPPASLKTRPPSSRKIRNQWEMKAYLDQALASITGYCAVTAQHNGLTSPDVKHVWVRRGRKVKTACGLRATDQDAFYCPGDATIYIGLVFAFDLWNGLTFLPGGVARSRRARGDAGVAYVVAHEAAHAVSEQYRLRGRGPQRETKSYELGADCAAGMWANSMYRRGAISSADIQRATDTAAAVGDYVLESHSIAPTALR